MKTRVCSFFSFCAVWSLLILPMEGQDQVGYILTGRFHLADADPLGLHGAHFILTAVVDGDAEASSFLDEGDNQGTAVYPSGSCLTIWGAANAALNATYLPSGGEPDSLTAAWHSHSATDRLTFNATFLIDDGTTEEPVSMPRFYIGLNPDCLSSLPCVPLIDWVYPESYDLYGDSFSTSDVFGQSVFLKTERTIDETAIVLQYVVDAVAQVPEPGDAGLGVLWTHPDHRPVFDAVNPPYYAGLTVGSVDLSLTDPNGAVFNKDVQEVPEAVYLETTLGSSGSPADFVFIFNPARGVFELEVLPEQGATAEDAFSFIAIDRGEQVSGVVQFADSQKIGSAGSFSYEALVGTLDAVVSVKPGSCPKTVNRKSQGKLPVAVLGGADLDVSEIDPSTVRLNGKRAVRWSLEDVAGPSGVSPGCDGSATPDGVLDLVLQIETSQLIGPPDKQTIEVAVTGHLKDQFGGFPFKGVDTVQLRPPQVSRAVKGFRGVSSTVIPETSPLRRTRVED